MRGIRLERGATRALLPAQDILRDKAPSIPPSCPRAASQAIGAHTAPWCAARCLSGWGGGGKAFSSKCSHPPARVSRTLTTRPQTRCERPKAGFEKCSGCSAAGARRLDAALQQEAEPCSSALLRFKLFTTGSVTPMQMLGKWLCHRATACLHV